MKRVFLAAGVCLSALLFVGCPAQGVVCQPGTDHCGTGCADFKSDRRNCGGCGLACQPEQECQNSVCVCAQGSTNCGGHCAVLTTDPSNCGACGNACGTGAVCEPTVDGGAVGTSTCKVHCELGSSTQCGASCVDLSADTDNCGACGHSCVDGRVCKAGRCTYDVVLSCHDYGQLVGLRSSPGGIFRGPLTDVSSAPAALNYSQNVLFVTDDMDDRLLQLGVDDFQPLLTGDGGVSQRTTGMFPNHIALTGNVVVVTNAGSHTLQILAPRGAFPSVGGSDGGSDAGADAGDFDAGFDAGAGSDAGDGGAADAGSSFDAGAPVGHPNGLDLETIAELDLGANTFPEVTAIVGSDAYVALNGSNEVVRVSLTNPAAPQVTKRWALSGIDLHPFDGGSASADPIAITTFQNKVYAVLSNLDHSNYHPAGPGMLAIVDPANDATVSAMSLGADCQNPIWATATADALIVTCVGETLYDSSFVATSVSNNGVVMLRKNASTGALERQAFWVPQCAPSTTCPPPQLSRSGLVNNRLFVADQSEGRTWILDVSSTALTELPNVSPFQACSPTDATHPFSNVADALGIQ